MHMRISIHNLSDQLELMKLSMLDWYTGECMVSPHNNINNSTEEPLRRVPIVEPVNG